MVELEISEETLRKAKEKAEEMGRLRNSITKGLGNLAGFVGEEVLRNYIDGIESNTYDYDVVKGGYKIDVKTKRTTVKPKDYYEASIAAYNTRQNCDIYAFVRVLQDFSKAWILGWEFKKDYFERARRLYKGQTDGSNKFKVKADCYNLRYSELRQFKTPQERRIYESSAENVSTS